MKNVKSNNLQKLSDLKEAKNQFHDLIIQYLDSESASDTEDRRAKLQCYLYHKKLFKKQKKKIKNKSE